MVSGRFFCAAKGNPAGYLRREPVSDIDLWVRNLLSLVTENIETEELGLVFRVLTFDMSIGDLTALDQLRKTDQLTEFALQVKAVTFVSYQKYVALTGIDNGQESFYIYIMKFDSIGHN